MNYHYLWGFRYEKLDTAAQLDTDSEGLLTIMPETSPLDLYYTNSRSGRGFALDFGLGVVVNGWEFGFGANGVANRIEWEGLTLKRFTMESVLDGGDFVEERIPLERTDLRLELPVQYTGNASYTRKALTVAAQVSHGFQDTSFHAGAEYRLGIGLNLGRRFSIDAAAFWNTTNIERKYKPVLALSLRLNKPSFYGQNN